MGILKSAADIVYTIRFLKLLTTPIEETDAYKAGIIDEDGVRRKDFDMIPLANRQLYQEHYTSFHRLVYNLKKILAKAPGGNSVVARYGAALALIKEHGELSKSNVEKIHNNTGLDMIDILAEQSQWYVLPNGNLSEGVYRMANNTVTDKCDDLVRKDDQVRVSNGEPVHTVLGISVYEATHLRSKQRILITSAELKK